MTLSKSDKKSLDIINKTLKKEHGFTVSLDENISESKLNTIRDQFINEQRDISYTENAQKNPEYSQCALVIEATNILLGKHRNSDIIFSESKDTRRSEIDEMESLIESIKDKHPEKAEKLSERVNQLRDKMYAESKETELNSLLKENAQQAEVIMAGKNLFDTVQGFQTKIGELMNKQLDPFIERVRTVYGSDVADKMYTNMEDTLNDLMQQSRSSKEVFYNAVGVLTGEGGDMDDSVDDSEVEAEPSIETDDEPDTDVDTDTKDDSEEDIELDLDDIEDEFTRKEE